MINTGRRKEWGLAVISLTIFLSLSGLYSQERFRRNPPYPEPISSMKFPPIESAVLNNGLKIITITRLNHPIFNIQILIQAGEANSSPQLSGLATITARMLLRGTLSMSASEIENKLESLGIDYTLEVQADYILFSFTFLEENLDQALGLISSFFSEPSFPELELISAKRELYYQLLERKKDPENAAYDFFLKSLFSGSGYNPGLIDEENIKNIAQKDVVYFHKTFLRPNNSIIVLNGDININNAGYKISRAFNRWVSRPIEKENASAVLENKNYPYPFFLDMGSKDISIISGNVVCPVASDDYFPLLVLNQILGGGTGSRLFLTLRESKALVFYAFSDLGFIKNNGWLWTRIRTSPESAAEAIKEVQAEFKDLSQEKLDPLELEKAKAFLIGNFPLQNQIPEQISKRIGLSAFFQLPLDYWNRYNEYIMPISAERVQEVAKKYFSNQPLIVIAGDLNSALDYLKEFDRIEIYNKKGQAIATFQKGVLKHENH
jgi:zinc protease